jgi:hypothetical protein
VLLKGIFGLPEQTDPGVANVGIIVSFNVTTISSSILLIPQVILNLYVPD